jgi:hypothetical protein
LPRLRRIGDKRKAKREKGERAERKRFFPSPRRQGAKAKRGKGKPQKASFFFFQIDLSLNVITKMQTPAWWIANLLTLPEKASCDD